ncbi:RlmE family RNA methyltransferase [bacterium]|nr:RlmE family RNA methyltransferase [bacterium]
MTKKGGKGGGARGAGGGGRRSSTHDTRKRFGGPHGTHGPDHYFARAKDEGYAARSVFKLEEIDGKHHLFRAGMSVVDLGCHPGSWLQYIARAVGGSGRAIGIDLEKTPPVGSNAQTFAADVLAMADALDPPSPDPRTAPRDFGAASVVSAASDVSAASVVSAASDSERSVTNPHNADVSVADALAAIRARPVDAVVSDMAPKTTGDRVVDESRSLALADAARRIARGLLPKGGVFLAKVFHGPDLDEFLARVEQDFDEPVLVRPDATRRASREIYVLARKK